MTIITDYSILTNLDYQVNRYIEICTLFYSLFSLSRTPCGDVDHLLEEVISLCLIKWRTLRLSMKMIKIQHKIEQKRKEQVRKEQNRTE